MIAKKMEDAMLETGARLDMQEFNFMTVAMTIQAETGGKSLLDQIWIPCDLNRLRIGQLPALAAEIRQFIIETVAKTGGHLASNLGTIELAIALHYVFDTPGDKIIWDVGHQAYTHKILTARKDRFGTLRQIGGISGGGATGSGGAVTATGGAAASTAA